MHGRPAGKIAKMRWAATVTLLLAVVGVYGSSTAAAISADSAAGLRKLQQLARQFDFPVFAPRWLPPGYVPLAPRRHPFGAELIYAPVSAAGTVSPETPRSLNISMLRATPTHAAEVPARAEPIRVGDASGWFQPGIRQPGGGGSSSLLTLMRDGTWISLSSFALGKEDLLRVAASLEPVPGSHPRLPNPQPRTLGEVRRWVTFPVFVPTDTPTGLTAEPPTGGEGPDDPVNTIYHTPDGAVALRVLSGPAGCCLDADPRKTGEPVLVRGGIQAHLLPEPPQFGGPILWWEETGAYVALSGPNLTEDQLLRIAGSMSSTAAPAYTELPPRRPAPPPVPPPRFRVLRPEWLPEAAQVWEEYVPGPPEHGSSVRLSFDPRPGDRPHEVLSLLEMPAGAAPEVVRDPSAVRERIVGREVTVIRRNEGCVTLFWVQSGVALTLTNAWDPPGTLRYSCDQMRRIVESVR